MTRYAGTLPAPSEGDGLSSHEPSHGCAAR
jgi:hypothetical protein